MTTSSNVPGIQKNAILQANQQLQELSQGWFEAQLFNGSPAVLTAFQSTVHDISSYLNTLLGVLQNLLDVSKTFTVSLVNPINTLVAQTLKAVQSAIRDIDQLGVYFTSDYPLLTFPYADVLGGYSAFERRMLGKLTDRQDPKRPAVSAETTVMAVFFYATAEINAVNSLSRIVQQYMQLFNISTTGETLPACGPIRPLYKNPGMRGSFANLSQAYKNIQNGTQPPTAMTLEWTIARSNRMGAVTIPLPPIDGFIVEVSTVPQGLALFCNRKKVSDGRDVQGSEVRESVIVRSEDHEPIILFGGSDNVQVPSQYQASQHLKLSGGQVKITPGSTFYFAKRSMADNEIISLDQLYDKSTQRHYLQRTFVVPQLQSAFSPTDKYQFVLDYKDLPYNATFEVTSEGVVRKNDAEQSTTYYVRVSTISDMVENSGTPGTSSWALQFDCNAVQAASQEIILPLIWGENLVANRGRPGPVSTVSFPSQYTGSFMESARNALLLLALLRIDMRPLLSGKTVTAEQYQEILKHSFQTRGGLSETVFGDCTLNGLDDVYRKILDGQMPSDFFGGKNIQASAWLYKLTSNVQRIMDSMYQVMGADPALEKILVDRTVDLRTMKLLDLAKESGSPGINLSADILQKTVSDLFAKFYQNPEGSGIAACLDQVVDVTDRMPFLNSNTLDLSPFPYYKATQYTIVDTIEDADARAIFEGSGWKGAPTAEFAKQAFETVFLRHMNREGYTFGAETEYDKTSTDNTKKWLKLAANLSSVVPFLPEGPPLFYTTSKEGTVYAAAFRRLFTNAEGVETAKGKLILEQASLILNVLTAAQNKSSQTSEWYALRLGDRLPGLSDMLLRVNQFVGALNTSLASSADVVQEYINFLQARIREIQQLNTQIDRLTQQLTFFQTPKCGCLVVFAKGSDDIASKLLQAQNKPQDGSLSYGAGGCIVVPTIPGSQFVLDLLIGQQN